jgi:ATP-dependent Clp protease protease subunit
MAIIQVPAPGMQIPGAQTLRGKTAYVSFSAEINAHTTESLIAMMADFANQGVAEVQLLLSTPGGVVMNGINLFNVLRALPFKLVTHNVGNVDSIGNVIFLAGEDRYAAPHSTFMFHGCQANTPPGTQLDSKRLREVLDNIDADELRIASIVEQRSKLDEAQIRTFFREAHTMNAAEAVGAGIIDEIRDVQIPAGSPVVALVFQR